MLSSSIYQSYKFVFKAIFSTYDDSDEAQFLQSANCICIFDREYHDYHINERFFCHYCFTSSANWITYLIAFLEICYEKILSCTIFHGSCVEYCNKSFLLLGKSKAGKSTLTYYLMEKRNIRYIDDDIVYLIDGRYVGFCTPISLRSQNINCNNLLEITHGVDESPRFVYGIPSNKIKQCVLTIDYILFPEYSDDFTFMSRQINGYELVNKIFNNIRSTKNIKNTFNEIKLLLSNASAFQLRYQSSEEALNFIDNLIV